MLEDFEKVKTKFEEQLSSKHKKAAFIDRKFLYLFLTTYARRDYYERPAQIPKR